MLALGILALPQISRAHCDTMNGPVVTTAQMALDRGDVTPVLKWVKPDDEPAIREAFAKTLAVRGKGKEAKALADTYFFETLVRLHRAGEGAPYTGLKSGEQPEGIITAADQALERKSADDLVKDIRAAMVKGIEQRFGRVVEARRHADESIAAGRAFVDAYVDYIHYVERLHNDITGSAGHGSDEADAAETPHTCGAHQ
jgi:hypothetical protein